jgi:hypothetical protein
VDTGKPQVAAFEFHCPECGYRFDFEISLDLDGRAGTSGGSEG